MPRIKPTEVNRIADQLDKIGAAKSDHVLRVIGLLLDLPTTSLRRGLLIWEASLRERQEYEETRSKG